MMTNFNLESQHFVDGTYNNTIVPNINNSYYGSPENISYYSEIIINFFFICASCIFGLVGNGIVIKLLGFHIMRNSFTTYILNLAVADIGVNIVLFLQLAIIELDIFDYYSVNKLVDLFIFLYTAGELLLTAISIDRCVAVFFPIWHRCHRPAHLSTTVCAFIWVLSFLLSAIHFTISMTALPKKRIPLYQLTVTALFCLPLMVFSTLTLSIHVCFKSQVQQRQQRKLLRVILLTLFFFLILAFPLNALYCLYEYFGLDIYHLEHYGFLCASLNSSVNPLVYFLCGRQKIGHSRNSMKAILQRLFKEEQDSNRN